MSGGLERTRRRRARGLALIVALLLAAAGCTDSGGKGLTVRLGPLILAIAGLNFLGLGVQAPTPEWAAMLNEAQALLPRLSASHAGARFGHRSRRVRDEPAG